METPCDVVRASTALVALNSQHVVAIDLGAIKKFVAEFLTAEAIAELKGKFVDRLASPLRFDSLSHEVNFAAVSAMLAFGSGHRADLHRICGSGAAQTMMYGMIGLHMTYGDLTASVLSSLSLQEVSSLFQVPLSEEYPLQPGVYATRASPLKPFAELIHSTLTSAGSRLAALGYEDFASYLKRTALKSAEFTDDGETRYSCQKVIAALLKDFSQFADDADLTLVPPPSEAAPVQEPVVAPEEDAEAAAAAAVAEVNAAVGSVTYRARVSLFKKAQLLVADLYTRCGSASPGSDGSEDRGPREIREPCFAWHDFNTLTVFADNVIPAMLSHLGVLAPVPRLAEAVEQGKALRKGQAAVLRAAAVAACEIALDMVNGAGKEQGEGQRVEDVLADMVASSPACAVAEAKLTRADNETGAETPLSPSHAGSEAAVTAFPRLPAFRAVASPRARDVLSGPELDFLLYMRGKETPELRKVPRHVHVGTAAY